MKKIKTFFMYIPIIIWFLWSFCFWLKWEYGELEAEFPYKDYRASIALNCSWDTDLWNCVSVKENQDTIIIKLLQTFWLDSSTDQARDLKFIDYARAIMNMALWLIAFIALIMSIYTFYLMIFSENEAWIKKAKWNLVGIFIALCVIWLARLIVSLIFWWYQNHWKNQENIIPGVDITAINITPTANNNHIYPII